MSDRSTDVPSESGSTTLGPAQASRREVSGLVRLVRIGSPLVALLFALGLTTILLALSGISPLAAYMVLARGAFGSATNVAETLAKASPLLLAGLAVAIAFRAGFWSVGAEGQIYTGALGAAAVAFVVAGYPGFVAVPLVILGGAIAGSLWGVVPAILKIRWHVNEIISTLMLNFVAILLTRYLVSGPWRDRTFSEPATPRLPANTDLPVLLSGTRLHAGVVVAVLAAVAVSVMLSHTTFGFRLKAVGLNAAAARLNRISWSRVVFAVMIVSGALAGLAGLGEVAGIHHRVIVEVSPGYGYMAIAVAMLGRGSPLGTSVSALFFAALVVGAQEMQRLLGVPSAVVLVMQGLIILLVLLGDAIGQRWVKRALA